MLNSIGLQNPGIEAFLESTLPRLGQLGVPIWVSVGGFSAEDYAGVCEQLDDRDEIETIELNLSCPNVEEAPETAAELVAAASAGHAEVALREALARDVGHRRVRARGRRRGCRRALADQHHPRPCTRARVWASRARAWGGRVLRPRAQADRARVRLGMRGGCRVADRRHGRRGVGRGRRGSRRGRRDCGRARDDRSSSIPGRPAGSAPSSATNAPLR